MERFALIGYPVAHSGSPELFRKAYGGRWPYDLVEEEDFSLCWKRFLDSYKAVNITAPFKEKAYREVLSCGVIDPETRALGAINIAVKEADGLVHGYNSDYLAVLGILREHGFGKGHTAVVAGFGGAGKAAAAAARKAGCDTVICNRTLREKGIRPLEELPVLAGVAHILIYTIPGPAACPTLSCPAILEANYRKPSLSQANISSSDGPFHGYIPGTEWLLCQARAGYPLMTGCPIIAF